tara:strand:- start:77 stop:904 length:828 start_codon:yes stop_codon:yes gene_type:complete
LLRNFLKKNNLFCSLIFFPFIYISGWVLISLLIQFFPFLDSEKSLYGTIITFVMFLLFLPTWSNYRWRKSLSELLGIKNLKDKDLLFSLLLEFFKALIIVSFLISILIKGEFIIFQINLDLSLIFNSLFLAIFVGVAEELVFRVWLFEELNLFYKPKRANLYQAILFALVHFRNDLDIFSNIQLFFGLFLLGLYLNTWRLTQKPIILLPIFFHGSLVGAWFFVTNSLVIFKKNIPILLFGPGEGLNINPVGGLIGIIILFTLYYFQKRHFLRCNF